MMMSIWHLRCRANYEMFLKVAPRELPRECPAAPEEIRGGKVFYDFTTRVIYDGSRVHEDNEQMQFYEGKIKPSLRICSSLTACRIVRWARSAKFLQKVIYGMAIAT